MKLSRLLGVLIVAAGSLVVPAGIAVAQCASTPSLETALSDTTVAFVGEVIESPFGSDEAVIRVDWIWKGGDLADEVVVRAPGGSGVSFRIGVNYIVIPENARAPYELDECSATRIYRADGEVIPEDWLPAVGSVSGLARQPGHSTEPTGSAGNAWLPIGAIAAMIGLVAIAVYWFRSTRRDRPLSSTGTVSGAKRGSWRRIGGPRSWSARSGDRQLKRMRRSHTGGDPDAP
ncbi:MAG: hypothetical protein ACN4GZ_18645 [Acidimicrobiales bacterium]